MTRTTELARSQSNLCCYGWHCGLFPHWQILVLNCGRKPLS